MAEGYRRGGVITLSWHLHNPASGGSSWDTTAAVRQVLPGGDKHALYMSWLSRVADFIGSLRHKGKPVLAAATQAVVSLIRLELH
jgi:hypothetical protein